MNRVATRGLVIVGWLLTPVAAWAVSFLGGWVGAVIGGGFASDAASLGSLGAGATLGAVAGAGGWVLAMRILTKYFMPQSKPGDSA